MILPKRIISIDLKIEAGKGGDGVVSFRREKFVPKGGPNGGDGGRGGDVWIVADRAVENLEQFKNRRYFKAGDGRAGSGNNKRGRDGVDTVINAPVGTKLYECSEEGRLIAELNKNGERIIIAKGGRGGHGNAHFVSSRYQVPHMYQRGEKGELLTVRLEYTPRIDIGIIGKPNSGKSTLLHRLTGVNVKIAGYPFTTVEPEFASIELGDERFIIAELPALIKNSSLGKGLGNEFLRYLQESKVIIILIDAQSDDCVKDYEELHTELTRFEPSFIDIDNIVAVNKADTLNGQQKSIIIDKFREHSRTPFFISATTGEGTGELLERVRQIIVENRESVSEYRHKQMVTLTPEGVQPVEIYKEGDAYIVNSADVKYLLETLDYDDLEARSYLIRRFRRKGLLTAFKKAGISNGDKIKVGEREIIWEWL